MAKRSWHKHKQRELQRDAQRDPSGPQDAPGKAQYAQKARRLTPDEVKAWAAARGMRSVHG